MPRRISSTNQCWNSTPVSSAPPPAMNASGSKTLIISSRNNPSACAWMRNTLAAERVALLGQTAHQFGGLVEIADRVQLVSRLAREQDRQNRLLDRGERTERLEIADAAAVAERHHPFDAANGLVRNQDMAELAAESLAALDDLAGGDDAAAESGADDDRHGRQRRRRAGPEERHVAPERRGVAIVQIRHRLAQQSGDGAAA